MISPQSHDSDPTTELHTPRAWRKGGSGGDGLLDIVMRIQELKHRALTAIQKRLSSRTVQRRLLLVTIVVLTILGWWISSPILAARAALAAYHQGDAATLNAIGVDDAFFNAFFDEWANESAFRHENGTPRAISFSVRPEALQWIKNAYQAELERIAQGSPPATAGLRLRVGPWFRFDRGDRLVSLTARANDGSSTRAWIRLHRTRLTWHIVSVHGAVPFVEFVLTHRHP